ncbi:MAG TPA: hypothetical protein VFN67_16435 [Polyangiales bacterium]|nr:hypothetical protein [Polyangiales bacterium]
MYDLAPEMTGFPKKHGVYSLLRMLLQLLTVLIVCEVSGAVHVALDVAAACGQVEHGENDCEQDGHECPPGCPGCHCPNGAPAWQAPTFTLARALNLPRPAADFDWQPDQPPREVDTSGLFRPPK